jgi:ParB family transcriptional regulator, chromosome partitioning protein
MISKPETNSTGQLIVKWEQLRAGQYTPRCTYDLSKLNQLATSIKKRGIAQPLLVKPDIENGKQIYWIVAGERRYRAAKLAGLSEIPVLSKDMTTPEAREYALLENTQREDLTDMEEAEGYAELFQFKLGLDQNMLMKTLNRMHFELNKHGSLERIMTGGVGAEKHSKRMDVILETFETVGRITWRNYLVHRLALLNYPNDVKDAIREGLIRSNAASELVRLQEKAARVKVLGQLKSQEIKIKELRTVIDGMLGVTRAQPSYLKIRDLERRIQSGAKKRAPEVQKKLEKHLTQIDQILEVIQKMLEKA